MGRASAAFQMINDRKIFRQIVPTCFFHRERKGLRSRGDVLFIVMKKVYTHDEKRCCYAFANKKQGRRRYKQT